MGIANMHVALGVTNAGEAKVLYFGPDAAEASKAFAAAGPDFAEVGIVPNPSVVFPRRPAEEKAEADRVAKAAAARQFAEEEAARQKIADLKAKAKQLADQAKELEAAAAAKPPAKADAKRT